MTKEWFTASELAGLPGLPNTDRNVRLKAQKEGWKFQKRTVGKGYEFHISSIPTAARTEIQKQRVSSLALTDKATQMGLADVAELTQAENATRMIKQKGRQNSLQALNSLSKKQQNKAAARARVLQLQATFLAPYKEAGHLVVGEHEFVSAYNAGELELEEWIKGQVKKVSFSTLRRWQKQNDEEGIVRLAGNYQSNQREGLIERQPELQNYVIALVTGKPHLVKRPHVIKRMIEEKVNDFPHWQIPSASSVSRWRDKWMSNNIAKFTNLTNPDSYNSKHRPLFAKMYPWLSAPNDCWEFDSTPTDVQLRVNGKLVRYNIIAAIDVFTRRVKLLLAPTSSSEGICLLLRKCLLEWGMLNPQGIARTDNGSDYVSHRVTTVFQMLDIDQSRANPFSGWEKPYIERFFRTLSSALFELLPGYIGHNVTDRQQIEAAKAFAQRIGEGKKKAQQEALELALSPDELETIMNDWLEHRYNHTAHEGLNGETPFTKYANSGYRPNTISDPHSLDMLLNFVSESYVIRGGVKAGTIRYTAPELMNPDWDRKKVRVFNDPTDVGQATLYSLENHGVYVEAVNDELVGKGISPEQFRHARKQHSKAMAQFRKTAKKLQDEFGIDTQYAQSLAADKAKNNLAGLNLPGIPTDNPMLGALSKANRAKATQDSRTENELEQLETARQKIADQERELNQKRGLVIRNIHEKARALATESITRQLTETEEAFLHKYKKENPLSKKQIEEIMAQRRQA
ncbi:Mu transposase C-terminal domain-containing protein [Vibrio mediterranei]|uniref:DNA-binding protein n=1 Tax=Vibrio mediterranei TaxID=689 RepID=UPI001EFE9047|nr:DNA-binding protein [Vibrio mediterranei]MCG9624606.1 Mu transposase C-terminal domain-containing protein [Vibrio mediterranei]